MSLALLSGGDDGGHARLREDPLGPDPHGSAPRAALQPAEHRHRLGLHEGGSQSDPSAVLRDTF